MSGSGGILDLGRLSPALPGSTLLFTLAFGCGLASNWIISHSNSTTAPPEVPMDATKKKRARQIVPMAVSTFLATVAEVAAGIATSG